MFDGDGYSKTWEAEAKSRGLLNLKSTVDAVPYLCSTANIELFKRHGVLNKTELTCRADTMLEKYSKILHIEALTLCEMIKRDVMPAIIKYTDKLSFTAANKANIGISATVEKDLAFRLSDISSKLYSLTLELENSVKKASCEAGILETALLYNKEVLPLMEKIRYLADRAESITAREYWPYPTYGDLLFKI